MSDPSDPRFTDEEGGYIHPPDRLDDDPGNNGLVCFLDNTRPCGPDCMAYTLYTAEPKHTELGEQSRNCSLLVNIERMGVHSVILANLLSQNVKAKKIEEADRVRSAHQQPPPSPIGGT